MAEFLYWAPLVLLLIAFACACRALYHANQAVKHADEAVYWANEVRRIQALRAEVAAGRMSPQQALAAIDRDG